MREVIVRLGKKLRCVLALLVNVDVYGGRDTAVAVGMPPNLGRGGIFNVILTIV